jgi:hypothetical protein
VSLCLETKGFRYLLAEPLLGSRRLLWVMLNPSTADATQDDPTIRKVRSFTKRLGFDSWSVVNLYARRATKPRELAQMSVLEAIGNPENDDAIAQAAKGAKAIVLAWGAFNPWPRGVGHQSRIEHVVRVLRENTRGLVPMCLGKTRSGNPSHPLMLSYGSGRSLLGSGRQETRKLVVW